MSPTKDKNMNKPLDENEPVDKYGNPTSGDRIINCCFPDCGCDGARLCQAENGCSERASTGNVEGMWQNGKDPTCCAAVFALVGSLNKEKS